MPAVLRANAARHRRFSAMAASVIESHNVPAVVVPQNSHMTLASAFDDPDLHPDVDTANIWISCSTSGTRAAVGFLDSTRREARLAESDLPVASLTFRLNANGTADALATMTLDDLARLLSKIPTGAS